MSGLQKWLGSIIRKGLFAVASVWIAKLIEAGVLTEGDITRFIEILVAGLIILGTSLWSSVILPWLKKILTRKFAIKKYYGDDF